MVNLSRNHHYVPKCLSKHFVSPKGFLHGYIVGERRFVRRVPKKMFCEQDLHAQVDRAGRVDDLVEQEVGKIETVAAPIIRRVIDAARASRHPGLNPLERANWDKFFYLQWKRVPDFFKRSGIHQELNKPLEDLIAEYEQEVGVLSDDQRAIWLRPEQAARFRQNVRAKTIARLNEPALNVLASRGLAVVRFKAGERLLLGSNPVVKLAPGHTSDLRRHEVEAWLPIAPDVMVGVGTDPGTELYVEPGDIKSAGEINDAILRQSSIIASSSQDGLYPTISRLAANSVV